MTRTFGCRTWGGGRASHHGQLRIAPQGQQVAESPERDLPTLDLPEHADEQQPDAAPQLPREDILPARRVGEVCADEHGVDARGIGAVVTDGGVRRPVGGEQRRRGLGQREPLHLLRGAGAALHDVGVVRVVAPDDAPGGVRVVDHRDVRLQVGHGGRGGGREHQVRLRPGDAPREEVPVVAGQERLVVVAVLLPRRFQHQAARHAEGEELHRHRRQVDDRAHVALHGLLGEVHGPRPRPHVPGVPVLDQRHPEPAAGGVSAPGRH